MAHKTNRYKKPNKRAAYERALELAKLYTLDPGAHLDLAKELGSYELSREERKQVAAKAIRVERGRRRRAG